MQAFLSILLHFPAIPCHFIYSFGEKNIPLWSIENKQQMLPFIHKKQAAKLEPCCW